MAANSDTVARILDGALLALARRGQHKLAMSDVCATAGVSRGTLYRYFRNKEEVLEAVGRHVRESLRRHLTGAVDERPDLQDRVEVVVEAIVGFVETHPETAEGLAAEPEWSIAFIRNVVPEFITLVEELLTPALELTPTIRSGLITSGELAELILRVCASTYFIPTRDLNDVPRAIAALPCLRISEAAR